MQIKNVIYSNVDFRIDRIFGCPERYSVYILVQRTDGSVAAYLLPIEGELDYEVEAHLRRDFGPAALPTADDCFKIIQPDEDEN